MNKFGTVKSKVLEKITEAYINGKKDEVKDILMLMKEDKDFVNLYLFYEEIENTSIDDTEMAKLYVEEIMPVLTTHSHNAEKFCKKLNKKLGDVNVTENELYKNLDILAENNTLKNVDKKIKARKKIVEHLLIKKEVANETPIPVIQNESLLHTVLANNFNVLYGNTLNEEEKKQLSEIFAMSDNDLNSGFQTLKEEVTSKMNTLFTEEKNDELKTKLNHALTEALMMSPSKYNYYKLQQLKKGL